MKKARVFCLVSTGTILIGVCLSLTICDILPWTVSYRQGTGTRRVATLIIGALSALLFYRVMELIGFPTWSIVLIGILLLISAVVMKGVRK